MSRISLFILQPTSRPSDCSRQRLQVATAAQFNSHRLPTALLALPQAHQAAWYFATPMFIYVICHDFVFCSLFFSRCPHAMSTQISNPLDVIKTRLQTQGEIGGKLGIAQIVRLVYSEGGFGAFFRGLGARMLYHAPAAAFQMVTYEAVKVRLRWHSWDLGYDNCACDTGR
jgi:hypothetical protein